jgi:hypothetical protein
MSEFPLLAQAMSSNFSNGYMVAIMFWVCIALMVIVPSLGHYWQQAKKVEAETALKQQMVERGYSAEEILAVVNNDTKAAKNLPRKGAPMTPSKLPPEYSQLG